ncbi:MAG: AMIN domain-containing protein [Leptolyngbyaceae bacterium]|nr:AMIN domain-containing protein [Leptolyngbyaceae bacterium]
MKHSLGLAGGLVGSALGVLVAPTAWAQMVEIRAVEVNPRNGGIEVILQTSDGDRPQIFTVSRGNSLVADVINTQLQLPNGNGFFQNNPAPGITAISVSQLDSNSVRVQVDGDGIIPTGQVSQDNGEVVFTFSTTDTTTAMPPTEVEVEVPPASVPTPSEPVAQTPGTTEPLFEPQIEIDGFEARRERLSNAAPTPLPRAIAPPVGDIAVSTLDPSPSTLILGTSEVIPRLVLRDAPVREVLSLLARAAGLNLAYVDGAGAERGGADNSEETVGGGGADDVTVSLDIENEPIQDVFNYVIRISGVEASRFGRTIFVSPRLPDAARNTVVRTLRLNQVEAEVAATYLATLGAEAQIFFNPITQNFDDEGNLQSETETVPTIETVELRDAGDSPSILKGLGTTIDDRLNSITIYGTPRTVQLAMQILTQLDARQRQVAVNVKIVDVDLLATENFGTSFSFALDNENIYFNNDGGNASLIYGGLRPPSNAEVGSSLTSPPTIATPYPDGAEVAPFFDNPAGNEPQFPNGPNDTFGFGNSFARPNFGTFDRPFQPGISDIDVDDEGGVEFEFSMPGLYQFPSRFLAALEAQVVNNNAKILTDPTLIVQEGQVASVQLIQQVVTNITVNRDVTAGGVSESIDRELGTAGLILNIVLDRIDDNGFVTMQINPTVSSPTSTFDTGDGEITLLSVRNLQSGQVRLRDGQTLVLSGIISETDRVNVSKVPILGDLPIIGSLFRRTSRNNSRTEVVVLVTPEILDDSDYSDFGYGYVPQIETQQFYQR